jgi:pilus assembly protein Flp/PilA
MRKIANQIAEWLSIDSDEGATAIEYGIIAATTGVVIIAAAALVGANFNAIFSTLGAVIK